MVRFVTLHSSHLNHLLTPPQDSTLPDSKKMSSEVEVRVRFTAVAFLFLHSLKKRKWIQKVGILPFCPDADLGCCFLTLLSRVPLLTVHEAE